MGLFQSLRRPAEAHLVIGSDNYGENISSRLGAERTTRPRARRLQCADRGDRWKHPDHRRYPNSRESTYNRASTRKRSESHFARSFRSSEGQTEPEIFAKARCRSLDPNDFATSTF